MANDPVTLETVVQLIKSSDRLQKLNHDNLKEMIDKQNVEIKEVKDGVEKQYKEIKDGVAAQCEKCPKIGAIDTQIKYLKLGISFLAVGVGILYKVGYDFQGKILEFIGGRG